MICPGCNQIITITNGKSECGGEGEGICCVFADDEDPCSFHPDGHDHDAVFQARAAHQAAFRSQSWEEIRRTTDVSGKIIITARSGTRVTTQEFLNEFQADAFDWEADFQFALRKACSNPRKGFRQ